MAADATSLKYRWKNKMMPVPKPMPEIRFPKPLKLNRGVPIPGNWADSMIMIGIDLVPRRAVF